MEINIIDIIAGTTVDGPGLRTSIYMSGCNHKCFGCHNPQSWDPKGGKMLSIDEIIDYICDEDFNVTLTGGDPLYNPHKTYLLTKKIKDYGYSIWLYTGYRWEEIIEDKKLFNAVKYVDVIVDGKFDYSKKDVSLKFRGSSNQRIIDVKKSIKTKSISLWVE